MWSPSWEGHYLDVGVLNQAELLLDLVQFFLLPPDVGLQHPRPLLQLVFDRLERMHGDQNESGQAAQKSSNICW